MRGHTERRKREALESQAKNKMLDELIGRYDFPVPESFVQQRVDARLERGLRALAQQGMKSEDMRKLDFARLRAAQRTEAEREVRASLVVDKIADAEQVQVADDELDKEVLMMSMQTREPYENSARSSEQRRQHGTASRRAAAREDESSAV